jgi:hypothetical protein
MAITLNGTTGITTPASTVGGSAVLTAASSLAAANLTGALPASAMPSGSVLQVKYATWGTATTITTTGVQDLFSGTITVQNGSRCVLMSKVEKYRCKMVDLGQMFGQAFLNKMGLNFLPLKLNTLV